MAGKHCDCDSQSGALSIVRQSRSPLPSLNKPPSETEIYFKSLKPSKAEFAFCSILPDRAGLSLEQTPSAGLAASAMSFTRVEGSEEAATDETFPHHAPSAAHVLSYPFQVLARAKTELDFDMIQKMKRVAVKYTQAFAACRYKVVNAFFVNSRCCWRTAPF